MKLSVIIEQKENRGIKLYTIDKDKNLQDVAVELTTNNVGALLVLDKNETPVGIISERDIIKYCCNDTPLSEVKVSDVMHKDIIVVQTDDTPEKASTIMAQNHIRHLPVFDTTKKAIIGMITVRDIIQAIDEAKDLTITHMSDYIGGTYGSNVF